MKRPRTIECFGCRHPVSVADVDCYRCGREVALELAERDAASLMLRCVSLAVAGGGTIGVAIFGFLLTGISGHEKTFLLAATLGACVSGLIWFASDAIRPTPVKG